VYELIVSFLIFTLLWFRRTHSIPGSEFLLFTALTAGSHLFLEAFRGDSILILGGVRLGQVVAWLVLALALIASESIRSVKKSA
jgi:prolipoprotein diacylglyceryltransferase